MPATRYLELLDWCGREICSDKRGAIAADLAPLLGRLKIRRWLTKIGPNNWLKFSNDRCTSESIHAPS